MTVKEKVEMSVVGLVVLLVGAMVYIYIQESRERAIAETTIKNQNDVIKQLHDDSERRSIELMDKIAELEKKRMAVQTPVQVIRELPQFITLPAPVTISQPAPTPENPNPAPVVDFPVANLKPLFDKMVECKECSLRLEKAVKDIEAKDMELLATQKQRDAAMVAMKGGTFGQRLKREAKSAAFSGIGAAAGAGACSKSSGGAIAACAGVGALSGYIVSKF